jgi:hypothetical protein
MLKIIHYINRIHKSIMPTALEHVRPGGGFQSNAILMKKVRGNLFNKDDRKCRPFSHVFPFWPWRLELPWAK